MSKAEKSAAPSGQGSQTSKAPRTIEEKNAVRAKLNGLTEKAKEAKKEKELKTDKHTVKEAVGTVTYEKALKWKYPEDVTTARDRKVFRAKHRKLIRALMLEVTKLEGEAKEAKEKELNRLKKRVLLSPETSVL